MGDEIFIAIFFVIFGFFEFFYPSELGHSWSGRLRNGIYAVFVLTVGAFLSSLIFRALPFNIRIIEDASIAHSLAYALAYSFLADFMFYWYHRAQHKFLSLWALHELHHSDAQLNVVSSYRTYWLDYPVQTIIVHLPVFLVLGLEPRGLLMAAGLMIFYLMFAHANLRLHLGRLTPVIVGPQLHRIHHSNLPQHRDKNLAQAYPIFDILFGTYYAPAHDEFPPTGTDHLPSDAKFAETLLRPFAIWRNIAVRQFGSGN